MKTAFLGLAMGVAHAQILDTTFDYVDEGVCNNGVVVTNYGNPTYIGSANARFGESDGVVYSTTSFNFGFTDENNYVIASNRVNGELEEFARFYTNGRTDALYPGELFAYTLIPIGDNLLAVANPGSNDISIFGINEDFTLTLLSMASVSGEVPVTMAETGTGLLYVATYDVSEDFVREDIFNRLSPITGLRIDYESGQLGCVEDNVIVMSGTVPGLRVNPGGNILVAEYNIASESTFVGDQHTELVSLQINADGSLTELGVALIAPDPATNWPGSAGFSIERRGDREFVVVTEVRDMHYDSSSDVGATQEYRGDLAQPGTVTSWELLADGSFELVNTVQTGQPGVCWIVFNKDATVAWTANFGAFEPNTESITSLSMSDEGEVAILDTYLDPVPDEYGFQGMLDIWLSEDDKYLFVQYSGGVVQGLEIGENGYSLTPSYVSYVGSTSGLVVKDRACVPCDGARRSLLMGDFPCC